MTFWQRLYFLFSGQPPSVTGASVAVQSAGAAFPVPISITSQPILTSLNRHNTSQISHKLVTVGGFSFISLAITGSNLFFISNTGAFNVQLDARETWPGRAFMGFQLLPGDWFGSVSLIDTSGASNTIELYYSNCPLSIPK